MIAVIDEHRAVYGVEPICLKQFRRAATCYDKLLASFRGFVLLAAIAITLA